QAYLDAAEQSASEAAVAEWAPEPMAEAPVVDAEPDPAAPAVPAPVSMPAVGHVAPALSAVIHDHDQHIDD
ncbi:hypothetical protein ABXW85_23465, partial [Streptococcus suis]